MLDKDAIKELSKAEAITAAASALAEKTLVALPVEFSLHDLERHQPNRRRARGTMTTSNITDFATYATDHAQAGAAVFVDMDSMIAVAVLNLGTPDAPGHADERATLAPKKTAAYTALLKHTGMPLDQAKAAELLEDWPGQIDCFNDTGPVTQPKAIAAVRRITIEALKKLETTEAQLSASRSAFESISASSPEPLPTTIYFNTVPFHGLAERRFVMRLGIQTGGAKPAILLRIVNAEQHDEDMAAELAGLVTEALPDLPVLVGSYAAGA